MSELKEVLVVINLGTLVALVVWVSKIAYKIGQITLKVDTVWDFLIKRAKVEFVQAGLGTVNSPVVITPESFEKVKDTMEKILPVYIKILTSNPNITEKELFIEFEREFGDLVTTTLCIPNRISMGACIVWLMKACEAVPGVPKAIVTKETRIARTEVEEGGKKDA